MYLGNKQYGATAATGVKGDMLASSQWVGLLNIIIFFSSLL